MTEAVKHAGCALEFASPELQKDQFIVLAAVRNDGDALQFAAPEFQDAGLLLRKLNWGTILGIYSKN